MIKKVKFNTKELKIKLVIVCSLLIVTVLSFFFAEKLELLFNLKEPFLKGQVSQTDIVNSKYEVEYLDVGQGNSAFIRLPDGKTALIDGGNLLYGEKLVKVLKDKGVTAIDYMFATHADSDHIGGLLFVLDSFEVKNIYRPFQISGKGDTFENFVINPNEDLAEVYLSYAEETNNRTKISRVTSEIYADFITKIYSENYFENGAKNFAKVTVFYDGLKILGENYSFEFFAPFVRENAVSLETITENTYGFATMGYGASDSNGSSAIFLFSCLGETFFFSGDASFSSGSQNAVETNFLETDFLSSLTNAEKDQFANVSVLLAGHHGSKHSTSKELLELLRPEYIVISVGDNNISGHPHSEVFERIQNLEGFDKGKLFQTRKMGGISFSSVEGNLGFSYEVYEQNENLTMSWFELSTIFFIVLGYIIVLIKPKATKRI